VGERPSGLARRLHDARSKAREIFKTRGGRDCVIDDGCVLVSEAIGEAPVSPAADPRSRMSSSMSTSCDGHRASQRGIGGHIAALLQRSGSSWSEDAFFSCA
jgi:hypothetical protein